MILGGFELFRLGVRNLFGYPLRTLLTIIGVVFGVASVMAMIAVGAGAEQELLKEFGRLGIENIIVNSIKPTQQRPDSANNTWGHNRYGITYLDEELIRTTIPGLREVLPVAKRTLTAWSGSRQAEVSLTAVHARHLDLFRLTPQRGRPLCAADGATLRNVCLIREGLLTLLGIFDDPIGRVLLIGGGAYEVVGVLPEEHFGGYAQKVLAVDTKRSEVYIPYETFANRVGTAQVTQRQGSYEAEDVQVSQLIVAVRDADEVIDVSRMVNRVLAYNHKEERDYEVVVPLEHLAQRQKTQGIFNDVLFLQAAISLIVGGIGIANIMLASVTERTREIGVRRALGAKRRHILAQFLVETVIVSTLGGFVGVGSGYGLISIVEWRTGWTTIVTPTSIVLAVAISVGIGIISGIFPARRAAMLDPIAALRHE